MSVVAFLWAMLWRLAVAAVGIFLLVGGMGMFFFGHDPGGLVLLALGFLLGGLGATRW